MDKENMNKAENAAQDKVNDTAAQTGAGVQPTPEGGNDKKENVKKKSATTAKKKGKLAGMLHAKQLRYGGLSVVMTVVVIVLVMLINYVFSLAETNFAWSVDLSYNQKFSISDTTKEVVEGLDQDVKVYTLLQENSTTSLSTMIDEMLTRYKALGHITVENLDIVANPTAANRFQTDGTTLATNSIIVSNADESKFKVITQTDMYDVEYSYNQSTGSYSYSKYDFIGEQAVTSAILYVTSEDTPNVYVLQGHGEVSYDSLSHVTSALSAQNYEPQSLSLTTSTVELGAGDVVMIIAPTEDLPDDEYEILKTFLENGGRMYYASHYGSGTLKNFEALLGLYGLELDQGLVVENVSENRYYRNQLYLMPNIALTDADGNELAISSGFTSGSYVVLPNSQAIKTPEMKQSGIIYTNLLTTSAKAYIKSTVTENTTIAQEDGDETGTFNIAIAMAKDNYDDSTKSTRIFTVGNAYFLADSSLYGYYDNNKLLLSPMEWLVNRNTSVYVASKSMGSYTMSLPDNTTYQVLTVTVIIAIPVIILLAGFIIWRRRRHL